MGDFHTKKSFQGADSCILIGRAQGDHMREIGPMERLLWIVDDEGAVDVSKRIFSGCKYWERLPVTKDVNWREILGTFLIKTPRLMPSLYITKQIPTKFQDHYATMIEGVVSLLEEEYRIRVTRQQDAFAWQSNLINNMTEYMSRRLPNNWKGALSGIPAFVCGAGPSFSVSAPELARLADRGVIFAGDSSLKALSNMGVRADFMVSVDVAKTAAKCLPPGVMVPGRAILTAISPPDWSDVLPRPTRYYLSGNQLTLDWLAAQGVSKTASSVCDNCGATAIELAYFMGCSPIYILGMDLSLSTSATSQGSVQRHHGEVDANTYANSGFNAQQEFPMVPGNFEAEIPTHVIGDWRALDQRIASYPTGRVIVVSDRGARLRNTTVLRPGEFVLHSPPIDKESLLAKLPVPQGISSDRDQQIANKILRFGEALRAMMPHLAALAKTGNLQEVIQRLRHIFSDSANGMMLGAYSLKIMPYLFPPIETRLTFWDTCLMELEQLADSYIQQSNVLRGNLEASKTLHS
jgi:hypothetical protein